MARNLDLQKIAGVCAVSVPLFLAVARGAADAAMVLCGLLFLYHSWQTKNWAWAKTPWFKLALATWAYLFICGVLADADPVKGLSRAAEWIRFPLFAIAASVWIFPNEKIRKHLLVTMGVVISLICVDALVQFLTGTSLSQHPIPAKNRLTGPLSGPVVGMYLSRVALPAIGLLFSWHATQTFDRNKKMILVLGFTALVALTTLFSGERMAFFMLALGLLIFAFRAQHYRRLLVTLGGATALLIAALILTIPSLEMRLIGRTAKNVSNFENSSYGHIFYNGITAWKIAPIFGIGPKNFTATCEKLGEAGGFKSASPKKEFTCARHPHNLYLEWLVETGMIGLLFFLGLNALWIREFWQRSDLMAAMGLAWLLPFLWPLASTMSFFSNWSAMLFWWGLGLFLAKPGKTSL